MISFSVFYLCVSFLALVLFLVVLCFSPFFVCFPFLLFLLCLFSLFFGFLIFYNVYFSCSVSFSVYLSGDLNNNIILITYYDASAQRQHDRQKQTDTP